MTPEDPPPTLTWGEFARRWRELPKPDPQYWEDVEAARREQGDMPASPWDEPERP